MDWQFIVPHMISGTIPMFAALALYYVLLRAAGRKQTIAHIFAAFVFCFYLLGILTMTGVCFKGSFSPRIVWIPFVDMIRGPVDTFLNVLLFVPLGLFLPLLYEKFDRIGRIAAVAFLISLSVEIAQLFESGASDINDLITNTVGACLGFAVFQGLCRLLPKAWINRIRVKGSLVYIEVMLFWAGAMVIMLTVQILLFHALFAASSSGEIQVWQ